MERTLPVRLVGLAMVLLALTAGLLLPLHLACEAGREPVAPAPAVAVRGSAGVPAPAHAPAPGHHHDPATCPVCLAFQPAPAEIPAVVLPSRPLALSGEARPAVEPARLSPRASASSARGPPSA